MKRLPLILVGLFIVGFGLMRACDADASEATFEVGPTYSGEFNGGAGLIYTERFAGKWDIGLMVFSDQDFGKITVQENGGIFAQRIVTAGKFQMGLGAARWIGTSRFIGCEFGFTLSLRYAFTDRWSANIRHWSNAGACRPNRGQDLLTIGYSFGGK